MARKTFNLPRESTLEKVLSAMPAMQRQIIRNTGLGADTVNRALAYLRVEGRAHIGDYNPPTEPGTKWREVFIAGYGKDAVLPADVREAARLATMRKCHHRRQLLRKVKAVPKGGGWAAALLVGL